jgi:hypothetical protein
MVANTPCESLIPGGEEVKPTRGTRRHDEQGVEEVYGCCSSNRNGVGWCLVDGTFPKSRKTCSRHLEKIKDARKKRKELEKSTASLFPEDGLDDIEFSPVNTDYSQNYYGDVTFKGNVVIEKNLRVQGAMDTPRADIAEWVERIDHDEVIRPGQVVGWKVGRGISLSTAGAHKLGVVSTHPGLAMNAPSDDVSTGNFVVFGNGQCQVRTSGEVTLGDRLFVRFGSSHGTVVALRHDMPLMRIDEGVQIGIAKTGAYRVKTLSRSLRVGSMLLSVGVQFRRTLDFSVRRGVRDGVTKNIN